MLKARAMHLMPGMISAASHAIWVGTGKMPFKSLDEDLDRTVDAAFTAGDSVILVEKVRG